MSVRNLHEDLPNEGGHRVGDWRVWELAEDKIRPESWGWSVTISAPPIATDIGGFVHSLADAETEVRRTLQAYGLTGQQVTP